MNQPRSAKMMQDGERWMNAPQSRPPNCPPGLEYLAAIDQVLVRQKVELIQVFTGLQLETKFLIKNNLGQNIYYAMEDSDALQRHCTGNLRSFDMAILDKHLNEVIHIYRPITCKTVCCPCSQTMDVYCPPDTLIGTIEEEFSIIFPVFSIKNANCKTLFKIKGPFCTISCGGNVDFQVKSGSQRVGKISKQWCNLAREFFTDADYFGVTFPMNSNVETKALMLGACFLINMMYYERRALEYQPHM